MGAGVIPMRHVARDTRVFSLKTQPRATGVAFVANPPLKSPKAPSARHRVNCCMKLICNTYININATNATLCDVFPVFPKTSHSFPAPSPPPIRAPGLRVNAMRYRPQITQIKTKAEPSPVELVNNSMSASRGERAGQATSLRTRPHFFIRENLCNLWIKGRRRVKGQSPG
jgi:hypothetical protein